MPNPKLEALQKFLSLIGKDAGELGGLGMKGVQTMGEKFPKATSAAGGGAGALLLAKLFGEDEDEQRGYY